MSLITSCQNNSEVIQAQGLMLDTCSEPMILVDKNLSCIYANQAYTNEFISDKIKKISSQISLNYDSQSNKKNIKSCFSEAFNGKESSIKQWQNLNESGRCRIRLTFKPIEKNKAQNSYSKVLLIIKILTTFNDDTDLYTHLRTAQDELTKIILNQPDPELILKSITEIAGKSLGVDRATIYNCDLTSSMATVLTFWTNPNLANPSEIIKKFDLNIFPNIYRYLVKQLQPLYSNFNEVHPSISADKVESTLLSTDLKSIYWYPFAITSNRVLVIALNSISEVFKPEHSQIQFIESVAATVHMSLLRKELISQQREILTTLRQSKKHYRLLFDLSPHLYFVLDEQDHIKQSNQIAHTYFHETYNSFAETSFIRLIAEQDVISWIQLKKQANDAPWKACSTELRINTPAGELHWASIVLRADTDSNNELMYFVMLEDIQHNKDEQENLKLELNAHMESQKLEAVGTMASGIAHDFNNILAGIMGYSELALMENQDENTSHALREISKATIRAKDLILQILTFSRRQPSQPKLISLTNILDESLGLLRASMPSSISIDKVVKVKNDTVLADEVQLQQIIINLCTNASHAIGRKSGLVSVIIANNPPGEAINSQVKSWISLSINDTGKGIPSEVFPRLFEPFFTTKKLGQGTGMGLAVVHGIVSTHNGFIEATNLPQGGASFTVYLPSQEKPNNNLQSEDPASLLKGDEYILFIDDEETILNIARRTFEGYGYKIDCFDKPIDAWNCFMKDPGKYDMVITDLTMPDITGLDLADRIQDVRPDIPIFLCSGHEQNLTSTALETGLICRFFNKPVSPRELLTEVRKELDY